MVTYHPLSLIGTGGQKSQHRYSLLGKILTPLEADHWLEAVLYN